MRAAIAHVVLILPLAWLSGCGGGGQKVWVTGKLLKGGVKYTPPEGQRLTITFYAIEAEGPDGQVIKGEPYLAALGPDGESITVPGRDGRGIPPGKYRVAAIQKMTREAFEAARPRLKSGKKFDRETDYLDEQFSPEKSPLILDVDGAGPIAIDLKSSSRR